MKTWVVEIPTTGSLSIQFELPDGSTKKDAFAAAWEKYGEGNHEKDFEHSWEAIERVTEGNVTHAMLNEQSAECVEEREAREAARRAKGVL